jgi:hypothetical protein
MQTGTTSLKVFSKIFDQIIEKIKSKVGSGEIKQNEFKIFFGYKVQEFDPTEIETNKSNLE